MFGILSETTLLIVVGIAALISILFLFGAKGIQKARWFLILILLSVGLGLQLIFTPSETEMLPPSPDCDAKTVGNFCFVNRSDTKVLIRAKSGNHPGVRANEGMILTLVPGETQCYIDLAAGPLTYAVQAEREPGIWWAGYANQGYVSVQACKTRSYHIILRGPDSSDPASPSSSTGWFARFEAWLIGREPLVGAISTLLGMLGTLLGLFSKLSQLFKRK